MIRFISGIRSANPPAVPQGATDEPAAVLLAQLRQEVAAVPAKSQAGCGHKPKAAEEQLSNEL